MDSREPSFFSVLPQFLFPLEILSLYVESLVISVGRHGVYDHEGLFQPFFLNNDPSAEYKALLLTKYVCNPVVSFPPGCISEVTPVDVSFM